MCSRYELDEGPRAIVRRFDLARPPHPWPDPILRPTNRAPVITDGDGGREAGLLRWGLPASWDGKPLINARAETLRGRKSFRPLLGNRCLVPATAYFEWRRDRGARRKNRIAPAKGGLFAFAGLTDGEHYTIVTCDPAPAIAHIHDRMPVILCEDDEGPWLDRGRPFEAVAGLLTPFTRAALTADEEEPPQAAQGDLFGP